MHLEAKAGEVGEDEIRDNFKFPSGLKSKCSIIHVKHAEDLERVPWENVFAGWLVILPAEWGELLCRLKHIMC